MGTVPLTHLGHGDGSFDPPGSWGRFLWPTWVMGTVPLAHTRRSESTWVTGTVPLTHGGQMGHWDGSFGPHETERVHESSVDQKDMPMRTYLLLKEDAPVRTSLLTKENKLADSHLESANRKGMAPCLSCSQDMTWIHPLDYAAFWNYFSLFFCP